MTITRLTKTIALVLVALVAFSGVADAKRKKRKPVKKRPVAAAVQAPTTRSWVSSAIVTVSTAKHSAAPVHAGQRCQHRATRPE